jgi:hypothetical protein
MFTRTTIYFLLVKNWEKDLNHGIYCLSFARDKKYLPSRQIQSQFYFPMIHTIQSMC